MPDENPQVNVLLPRESTYWGFSSGTNPIIGCIFPLWFVCVLSFFPQFNVLVLYNAYWQLSVIYSTRTFKFVQVLLAGSLLLARHEVDHRLLEPERRIEHREERLRELLAKRSGSGESVRGPVRKAHAPERHRIVLLPRPFLDGGGAAPRRRGTLMEGRVCDAAPAAQ